MSKLALYGAGDLGAEVLELYKRFQTVEKSYDEIFFVDDFHVDSAPDGLAITDFDGLVEQATAHDVSVVICIGEPRVRRDIAERLHDAGIPLATLIHPDVEIPASVDIGPGCIIYKNSYIGPNTHIGENSLIIQGFIAHNCSIGAHCVFDAHATLACHVDVGDQTFFSIGSSVKEGVRVGSRVIVGVGAAVFLDVGDDLYVVGNPARPMRRNEDQTVFRG